MTGYYKTEVHHNQQTCNIEVRSVNHRYLEPRIKLPKQFKCFENGLINQVKSLISRGKVDIIITLDQGALPEEKYSLNPVLWQNLCDLIQTANKDLKQSTTVNLSDLFEIKNLLGVESEDPDLDAFKALFNQAIQEGIEGLIKMRETEGGLLKQAIQTHLSKMETYMDQIPQYRQDVINRYKQKLRKNLKQIAVEYDEKDPRMLQEIGLFIDKVDITEEMERFKTHLIHFQELLNGEEPIGRKLDFLLQEFNREANTLCSKANHTEIAQIGVELKSEIEKVREQVQNIE